MPNLTSSDPIAKQSLQRELDELLDKTMLQITTVYAGIDTKNGFQFHHLASRVQGLEAQQGRIENKLKSLQEKRAVLIKKHAAMQLINQPNTKAEAAKLSLEVNKIDKEIQKATFIFHKNNLLLKPFQTKLKTCQRSRARALEIQEFKLESSITDLKKKYKSTVTNNDLELMALATQTKLLFFVQYAENSKPMEVSDVTAKPIEISNDNNALETKSAAAQDSEQVNSDSVPQSGDDKKAERNWCTLFIEKNSVIIFTEEEAQKEQAKRSSKGTG